MTIKYKRYTAMALVALFILALAAYVETSDDRSTKEEERKELNDIYEFSRPKERDVIEQTDPEIAVMTIMYFHMLLNEVDEGTFFRLKEETLNQLSQGTFNSVPDTFSKEELEKIRKSNEATLNNITAIDNLVIFEVEIEETTIRFKYLKDEERLFSEIKEVQS